MNSDRYCEHSKLKRSCDICDYENEIKELKVHLSFILNWLLENSSSEQFKELLDWGIIADELVGREE
jgi:hypothetical protein